MASQEQAKPKRLKTLGALFGLVVLYLISDWVHPLLPIPFLVCCWLIARALGGPVWPFGGGPPQPAASWNQQPAPPATGQSIMASREPVAIARFLDLRQAEFALSLLKGSSIEGFLDQPFTASLAPHYAFGGGGVRLFVRAEDAARAIVALQPPTGTDRSN